ncbi:Rv2578c family radical SAM protein [Ruania rhizosphaerae]|uniref:Rv2578c family radical SAM protein n=1 Tax=Ruania rhizosphaerae TaxID=1840413 RepID=UPI0013598462|nr:Rv2578c family radical SAM protein [Ruania rhizosphaerae]
MRWEAQQATDAGALLPLRGLIRSVTTPEFAGVTFHEVLCKSALNRVPGGSRMPFAWTINPTRGCLHQCVYCLSPDTLVLMADGRQKPIGELDVGDRIVGTRLEGQDRRYVETTVLASWRTRKRAYRTTLRDGTEIVASGDHRFLTARGWKYVAPGAPGQGRRAYLTINNSLMGFGLGSGSGNGLGPRVGPAITRKLAIIGEAVKTSADLGVASVEDLGAERRLVDITTGTGDFIANGVISHNCFARKTHEYLDLDSGADFDTQIVVKTNVAEVLRAELAKPSWKREHVALGTNSDPYMRAEGRYRLMPGIIEALTASRTPFSILTKGPLLRRDLPLLQRAAERVDVGVGISLAFTDPELQQRVEPGTPTPQARLGLIRAVADAGLRPTVMAMPILPWLTDSEQHLDELFGAIREAGGAWVTAGPLHLRPGAREWFMAWLAREYPALVPKYRALFGRGSYTTNEYRDWLAGRVRTLRRRHGFVRDDAERGARWTLRTDPDAVGDPALPAAAQVDPRPVQAVLF